MTRTPPSQARTALRALLTLAWPIVVARASQSVIGFCDALMTAPLGETALAAVTTGSLNAFGALILPIGTVFLLQSFTSQLRGRGELQGVHRYAWYGILLAVGSGLIAACTLPLVAPVLRLLGHERQVHELMTVYLTIRLLSVGPAVLIEALGNWYSGLGNTRPSMIAGTVTMIANVLGNYLLIEPRFGLPGYGVAGAAWASVIASAVGALTIAIAFARGWGAPARDGALDLRPGEFLRVLRFGLPNGVNWMLEFSAFALFINVMVADLGTTALAAFNTVIQINSISFMPAFGLASAGAIMVGEAIGRRAFGEAGRFVRLTLAVSCAWMVSIGLTYLLAPEPLMGLFAAERGALLVTVGASMLVWSAVWQLFDALAIVLGEALRAAGDTTWCMLARIVLAWVFWVPGAFVAVVIGGGGIPALMLSLIAYIALLAGAFVLRFASGRWRRIDLIGQPKLA